MKSTNLLLNPRKVIRELGHKLAGGKVAVLLSTVPLLALYVKVSVPLKSATGV